jgi:hypothetical protein
MNRYLRYRPPNRRYGEEESPQIRERYTSSSKRQRHTAARTARGRAPRLDALESGALGADQKAA